MKEFLQSRIWWAEYQIRQLTQGRGMRPGKAIRRLFPAASDQEVQDLACLWDDGFRAQIGADEELFAAAYQDVHSCMSGYGRMIHAAYTPHGIKIAVARGADGGISARALINPGLDRFFKAYGVQWGQLSTLLRLVVRLECREDWLGSLDQSQVKVVTWSTVMTTYHHEWAVPESQARSYNGRLADNVRKEVRYTRGVNFRTGKEEWQRHCQYYQSTTRVKECRVREEWVPWIDGRQDAANQEQQWSF